MKKVINITLGGQVFAIEQSAYVSLEVYVESIKQTLMNNADVAEIVSDIETAMAEKFLERARSEKIAVTDADVTSVVIEMGEPTEFSDASETIESPQAEFKKTGPKKRLYRDTDDVVIAGVASGIAQYFDVDPVIVRILFVVSMLMTGFGVLVYVILWLVVPAATTTTEKYAMSGDKVTLKEITERVKKNLQNIDDKDVEKARGLWSKIKVAFEKLFAVAGVLIQGFIVILRYVFGFALVLFGALTLAGLVTAYSVVLLSDNVLMPVEAQTALGILLSNPIGIIAISASFVMMVIPFLVLLLAGVSLLAKKTLFTVAKSMTLAVVWIVALVLAFTTSALQLEQVVEEVGPIHTEEGVYEININHDNNDVSIKVTEIDEEEGDESSAPK
jgi:phage shock protein PspC (stress-responsive transcriptional regulator)